MKKIAVVGTHGAGKSTLCYHLASHYKHQGKNVDVVQERIRFSPFPYNKDMKLETAMWGYHAQVLRELESSARNFEIIISDRSTIDYFIYAEHFKLYSDELYVLKQCASLWLSSYDFIIIVKPNVRIMSDGVRDIAPGFQESIHQRFMDYFDIHGESLGSRVKYISSTDIFEHNIDFNIF